MAGEQAADELVRMMEWIVASAYDVKALARRTQTAIIGLSTPGIVTHTNVSPRLERQDVEGSLPVAPVGDADDEVLSFAVLICAGDEQIHGYQAADPTVLETAGEQLRGQAGSLRVALSTGERPARTLERFASWIAQDYAGAVRRLETEVDAWKVAYGRVRALCQAPAHAYAQALAAALSGREMPRVAADGAREALAMYRAVTIASPALSLHPQLGVPAAASPSPS